MADAQATFAIQLDDQVSSSAQRATQQLGQLETQVDEEVRAFGRLRKMLKGIRRVTGAAAVGFSKVQAQSQVLTGHVKQLGGQLSVAGGRVGTLGSRMGTLGSVLSNPIVLTAVFGAGLAAMGLAAGMAGAALLRLGVMNSGAARAEALHLEGLNSLRRGFGMATASVQSLQAAMDQATRSTNLGRDTLGRYAMQLSRAGLRGQALTDAVEAMGMAAMVQGERGAGRFRALAFQAQLAGGSVTQLAERYRQRLGPIAQRQMLSLRNQGVKLKESLAQIFGGLRLEAFLSGIHQVTELFSQSAASGRALKALVETLFQPLVDGIGGLGPMVKRFFQGMVAGALLVGFALLRVRNILQRTFGGSQLFAGLDGMKIAFAGGVAVIGGMVAMVGGLAAAFAALAAGVSVFALPVIVTLASIGGTVYRTVRTVVRALTFVRSIFGGLATTLIDGLVGGLRAGVRRVVQAVRAIASSAAATFRRALGIASPSKVFAAYGRHISAGVVRGVDAGQPQVNARIGGLVDVPAMPRMSLAMPDFPEPSTASVTLPEARAPRSAASPNVSISIGDIVVHAGETSDPAGLAEALRDRLADILVGLAATVPAGGAMR